MPKQYYFDSSGGFIIKDYNNTHPFSNFLPGVAGIFGLPMWVYYVNRAQGVVSFGIQDKDHAILEFFPANQAYAFTSLIGFRTFLNINGKTYHEPFTVISGHRRDESMIIRSASLELMKTNYNLGLQFSVRYFTLPNSPIGALIRILSIKNISKKKVHLEVLDGLPRIIPFGSSNLFLKDLSRTLEAWMHSSISQNLAVFKLIVDPKDSAQTRYIEGANFNYSFYDDDGEKIFPYHIVDPEVIFAQDTSYGYPVKFSHHKFRPPLNQIMCGKIPCSFSHFCWDLRQGEEKTFYSIFGSSFKWEKIKKFVSSINADFLKTKEKENENIIEKIKANASSLSAFPKLDEYIKCSYLDNVLRGGFPYSAKHTGGENHNLPSQNVEFPAKPSEDGSYYIFSRKHGDLERDYNRFNLSPSYFSEGESNFRDINQNRRIDLFFYPGIGEKNIIYFFNFIKIDGYNPLVVKGEKLFFTEIDAGRILREFNIDDEKVISFMSGGFYLGEFFRFLEERGIVIKKREELAKSLIEKGERHSFAEFGEGYWIDHWRYNLDLIDNFLYFYPERIKELFLTKEYIFWDDVYRIKERSARYKIKGDKVYQVDSVEKVIDKKEYDVKKDRYSGYLHTKQGEVFKTNLLVKLLAIILNKLASVDPDGIGIEMEADKPGWCDSLNGLPALFGSSLCETLELKRASLLLLKIIKRIDSDLIINVPSEVYDFFDELNKLLRCWAKQEINDYTWWDKANSLKENFRKRTFFCLRGEEKEIVLKNLAEFLENITKKLDKGIEKAFDPKSGLYFTYFTYHVKNYRLDDGIVVPLEFERTPLPHFLESAVHILRVNNKKEIYSKVKRSSLFDKKLSMYRLNMSLEKEPLEIGRSRIFVPGWLENESIWLHMEYKYLLEVLKNGLYDDFFNDFYNCCVCFFDAASYGRNILENSSFIVSSAYPDKNLWGKGFVARLTGATVELLNIWMLLVLGRNPFCVDNDNRLSIKFNPILKGEMFTRKKKTVNWKGKEITIGMNSFAFILFSSIIVVYHNPKRLDTFKGNCKIEKIVLSKGDKYFNLSSDTISQPLSYAVRNSEIEKIDVYFTD